MRELHNEQFKAAGCIRFERCRYYDWRGRHICNRPQSPDFEAMKAAYLKTGKLIKLCEGLGDVYPDFEQQGATKKTTRPDGTIIFGYKYPERQGWA